MNGRSGLAGVVRGIYQAAVLAPHMQGEFAAIMRDAAEALEVFQDANSDDAPTDMTRTVVGVLTERDGKSTRRASRILECLANGVSDSGKMEGGGVDGGGDEDEDDEDEGDEVKDENVEDDEGDKPLAPMKKTVTLNDDGEKRERRRAVRKIIEASTNAKLSGKRKVFEAPPSINSSGKRKVQESPASSKSGSKRKAPESSTSDRSSGKRTRT